ncbi:MAG: C-GCAxxG-C-C family protein [Desulfurivibrionaceae bacterium]
MKNQESAAEIVALFGQRAGNIYEARGYCCSETVIYLHNQSLGGPLSEEVAASLGSGFCHGMGGAGCVCGGLAGAGIGLGLFLGPRRAGGMKKKEFKSLVKEAHDRFKARFGVTCCRVLLKRRKEGKGASCQELTMGGAEIAISLLLEQRPELIGQVDLDFLRKHESKLVGLAKRIFSQ